MILGHDPSGAAKLLAASLVWDNHACLPMELADNLMFLPDLERFRASGFNVLSVNCGYGQMGLDAHLHLLMQMRAWIKARPDRFVLIERASDVDLVRASGRLGVFFDIEGAAPLAGDLDLVDRFYAAGVRWMLLAYNQTNWAASGVHDDDAGLTAAGRSLIRRMEDVGMMVCLSHTGYRSAAEALAIASKPMIFSHSNALTLASHPRNIPDDLIRACADGGGVVGINGLGTFLGGEAAPQRVVEHMEHVAEVGGAQAVGLGLDFVFDVEGLEAEKAAMPGAFPPGSGYDQRVTCVPPEALVTIVDLMQQRGWREDHIAGALGQNWLRVAKACWRP